MEPKVKKGDKTETDGNWKPLAFTIATSIKNSLIPRQVSINP